MRYPLPESMRPSADAAPSVPRDAATIALLRAGASGTETYLLRRQPSMAFAAGMYVFPGGGVSALDAEPVPWVGPPPEAWAERFSCSVPLAASLVVAAVRETFEESGILLAGHDADTVVSDVSSPEFSVARAALDADERSFASFLAEHDLVLRADLVGAWSHWITPAFEPRRYDTRFFVAAVPDGQIVGSLPGEADRAAWHPVGDVLRSVTAGEVAMMPPTLQTCRDVVDLAPSAAVEASRSRSISAIEPRLVEVDGKLFIDNGLEDL
ncbi:hydrolase, NUDIX family [Aeromicrobium marinum DSM 15272]|uniref:Hydrolase, NUDIX family n=1 Tax=Aeromicrobium marinum DSM 15272 TaxID=585531 RepID=E2SC75_9ACTN|nr:hypothetical protein [Aeromicrobium marinum]EFQ83361.1 hydrolase, NUDIX family [Aeromicrobium marinum DSM 15272]